MITLQFNSSLFNVSNIISLKLSNPTQFLKSNTFNDVNCVNTSRESGVIIVPERSKDFSDPASELEIRLGSAASVRCLQFENEAS